MKRSRTYSRFAFSGTRALLVRTRYFCTNDTFLLFSLLSSFDDFISSLSFSYIHVSTCEISLYSARISFIVRSIDVNSSYGAFRIFRCLNAIVDSDKNASSRRVCSLSRTIEIDCNLADLLYARRFLLSFSPTRVFARRVGGEHRRGLQIWITQFSESSSERRRIRMPQMGEPLTVLLLESRRPRYPSTTRYMREVRHSCQIITSSIWLPWEKFLVR